MRRWIIFYLGILLPTSIAVYCLAQPKFDWVFVQTIAVILTGVILIWYTWETKRLREEAHRQVVATNKQIRETQRQIDVQLRPFLAVVAVWKNDQELGTFFLHNMGNGAAVTIKVRRGESELRIPFIPRGERVQVLITTESGTARSTFDPTPHPYGKYTFPIEDLNGEQPTQGILLTIFYNDVEYDNRGSVSDEYKYRTNLRIRPSGVEILSSWKNSPPTAP